MCACACACARARMSINQWTAPNDLVYCLSSRSPCTPFKPLLSICRKLWGGGGVEEMEWRTEDGTLPRIYSGLRFKFLMLPRCLPYVEYMCVTCIPSEVLYLRASVETTQVHLSSGAAGRGAGRSCRHNCPGLSINSTRNPLHRTALILFVR